MSVTDYQLEMRRINEEADHAMQALAYGLIAVAITVLLAIAVVAWWWL